MSEAVRQRIDENRNEADGLLQLGIGMLPEKLFVSVVRVEAAITYVPTLWCLPALSIIPILCSFALGQLWKIRST